MSLNVYVIFKTIFFFFSNLLLLFFVKFLNFVKKNQKKKVGLKIKKFSTFERLIQNLECCLSLMPTTFYMLTQHLKY